MLGLSLDAKSLAEIVRMASFPIFLGEETQIAMHQAGDIITAQMQANTWTAFQHPTGQLASMIAPTEISPYEVQIGVDAPQAHRLEAGFHGADSLGRVYDQAAEPYAQPALDAKEFEVLMLIDEAAQRAFMKIGAV